MECSDLEPLVASYIDGETPAAETARIEAHLAACAPCRLRAESERAAREVLRAEGAHLREQAPASLRARCERLCAVRQDRSQTAGVARRLAPVLLAAAAGLVVAFVWMGRVDAGTGVLAAQLTVDHVKCTKFGSTRVNGSPAQLAAYWQDQYGWPIVVPAIYDQHDLRLAGIRRCASSEGQTAHIIYTHDGRPVSLFIARDDQPRTPRDFEIFGHEAVVWSSGPRTYVLVGQEPRDRLQAVAATIRKELETP
jgi:anti-sigma factor RsiW